MKHEIITLENVQIIGMAKEIAFCKGQEECPKFWGEYVERIIKPVFMEHKAPDAFQEQYQMFYKEWLPQHSEFHCPNNAMTMEWYNGTDIESPDYQCGVMMPLE